MTTQEKPFIPVLDLNPEIEGLWGELSTAIENVIRSGQFIMGPEVKAFESEVAQYLGVDHAIGVNSGTDALVIALKALGVGEGDEVITTPFSFFATAESISILGARPVFVDIDEDSFNLDPSLIEAAITSRTKAIVPVHLYGRPCDMGSLMRLASEHGLVVVEDCAQAFGATHHAEGAFDGLRVGTIGHAAAFSFFPSKNLGAFGDGGLVTTNDDEVAELARMLRAHGAKKKYHNEILGYNSRLDTIQAAILRVKLPHVDAANEGRREAARRYNELLGRVAGVMTPEVVPGHVFHQYTIRLLHADRDVVQARLQQRGIGSMVYYPIPQDQLPVYKGQYPASPNSEKLAGEVLSLPIWPTIDEKTQATVAGAIAGIAA